MPEPSIFRIAIDDAHRCPYCGSSVFPHECPMFKDIPVLAAYRWLAEQPSPEEPGG